MSGGRTVLVVEDDRLVLELVGEVLGGRGWQVVTAADGVQGLRTAGLCGPDVIVMDLSLPLADGFEVARRLRRDPRTAHIPLVALTAHAMAGDRERVLEAGYDLYFTKPVDFEALLPALERLVETVPDEEEHPT